MNLNQGRSVQHGHLCRCVQGDSIASAKFAARENAMEAIVGKSAPEFPEGAVWLNGSPDALE
ncbi:MAG: hypothetical protein R3C56_15315 [Pirellulaceae bacterium]